MFDRGAIDAQNRLPRIQGRNRSWFAGAWTGYGFHEDGLRSAMAVVTAAISELLRCGPAVRTARVRGRVGRCRPSLKRQRILKARPATTIGRKGYGQRSIGRQHIVAQANLFEEGCFL